MTEQRTTEELECTFLFPDKFNIEHEPWPASSFLPFARVALIFPWSFGRVAKYKASFLAPAEHAHADSTQLNIAGNKHITNNSSVWKALKIRRSVGRLRSFSSPDDQTMLQNFSCILTLSVHPKLHAATSRVPSAPV